MFLSLFILFLISFVRGNFINNDEIADLVKKEVAKQISLQSIEQNRRISELEETVKQLEQNWNCLVQSQTERKDDRNNEFFYKEDNGTDSNNVHSGITVSTNESGIHNSVVGINTARKRLLMNNINDGQSVAFYAYMSQHQPKPGRRHTLIFDTVQSNFGSAYNKHDGIFTAPSSGYYVFTWTTASDAHGFIYTQIVQNSAAIGATGTDSDEINDIHMTTGIVVVNVNQGDVIYIRSHPDYDSKGRVISDAFRRSSFSGWKIF